MMRRTAMGLMAAAMAWGAGIAVGQEATSATAVTAQPTRVAMFKNGVGVVESKVDLPAPGSAPGSYELSPAPEALYGSFWLTWSQDVSIDHVTLSSLSPGEGLPMGYAASLAEVLRMSVGRRVEIVTEKDRFEGTILSVGVSGPAIQPRDVELDRMRSSRPAIYPWPGEMLSIRDDQGVRVLPIHLVQQVRFKDDPDQPVSVSQRGGSVLRFDVQVKDNKTTPSVMMHYLARGIAWSPSYLVDISNDSQARFSANVVVVNDMMDLKDVDVELVAGYPNLPFAGATSMLSPLPLDALLAQLRGPKEEASGPFMSNEPLTMQRAGGYESSNGWSASEMLEPTMPGEEAEDLYYYKLGKITLGRGERGYYSLIDARVAYEHLYTWDVPDLTANASYRDYLVDEPQVVWHAVKLTNSTNQPWTTAAAVIVADGRLLGQGMIDYTPTGGVTELKVTKALNVHAAMQEREVSRQRNAANFAGRSYDMVTIEGELTLTNFKNEPVVVRVTKMLTGNMDNKPDQAETMELPVSLSAGNGRAKLTWRVGVQPGERQAVKLNYRYNVYLRD